MLSRPFARAALLALLLSGVVSADSMQSVERAMGPYYAALVASAKGNIDGTSRHLLLFASRWESAAREARANPPRVIQRDPAWPALLDQVDATIARVRALVRARDVASAHAELESIRSAFREIRARHNALNFDDYMTDYHEALERLLGHVAGRNEIRLTPKDFVDADEDLKAATAAWQLVQQTAGSIAAQPGWAAPAGEATGLQAEASHAIGVKNATTLGSAAERLKSNYYDLLLAVARARG